MKLLSIFLIILIINMGSCYHFFPKQSVVFDFFGVFRKKIIDYLDPIYTQIAGIHGVTASLRIDIDALEISNGETDRKQQDKIDMNREDIDSILATLKAQKDAAAAAAALVDGCEQTYKRIDDKCIYMTLNEKTFNGATASCKEMGGRLVEPPVTSLTDFQAWMTKVRAAFPEKFTILNDYKHSPWLSYIYIGYYTTGTAGTFQSLSGTTTIDRSTGPNLINNPTTETEGIALTIITKSGQSVVDTLDEAGLLDTQNRAYICEKNPVT